MNRVSVRPSLITWARERARLAVSDLSGRFPKLGEWERGELQPTLRQLEGFAQAVHVPIGYLFLPSSPREVLPVPDLRTLADREVAQPSPNLLDTLYLCQQRQDWFRDYARLHGLPRLDFVDSVRPQSDVVRTAESIRATLGLSVAARAQIPTWTEALRQLFAKVEEAGVLVMASSIVGSNSHRKLEVEEFRGFALSDELAPLVFVNAADSKSAQMFTLAHELVHLWAGESGVSNSEVGRMPQLRVERWCNAVAAELLAPLEAVRAELRADLSVADEIQRLSRQFKVSTLVVLRRLFDAGQLDEDALWSQYRKEMTRLNELDRGVSGGGDFYRTLGARVGKRFARAVLSSTLEGQTLFQDAFRMLGVRKTATFYQAARELGVTP